MCLTFSNGFIHDQRLPQKNNGSIIVRNYQIMFEREKKWGQMLRRWDKKDTTEKLKRRIYKGIPSNKLRIMV